MGLLPTDGVFPLSPTLDTLGPLTSNAADAAILHAIMTGSDIPLATPLKVCGWENQHHSLKT